MIQKLHDSWKNKFPFRISTTSFIYPDSYVPNVKMLAPCFDEIELLFFEGFRTEHLPKIGEIAMLSKIGEEFNLTYNIHLPTDVSLAAEDPDERTQAVDRIQYIYDLTYSLDISTYTLHLPYDDEDRSEDSRKKWQDSVDKGIDQLLLTGIPNRKISVENLDYPIDWFEEIVSEKNLSFCLDLGHLLVNGVELETIFDQYKQQTSILHIHGVDFSGIPVKDHSSLDILTPEDAKNIINIIKQFKKTISIEVFSYENLMSSIEFLEAYFNILKMNHHKNEK